MRKRNILKVADTIFWYILYMLPIIAYLFYLFACMQSDTFDGSLNAIWDLNTRIGIDLRISSPLYTTLSRIFSSNGGILPALPNIILYYLAYFVHVFLAHLLVDIILFIPRFAMKWMDEFTKE